MPSRRGAGARRPAPTGPAPSRRTRAAGPPPRRRPGQRRDVLAEDREHGRERRGARARRRPGPASRGPPGEPPVEELVRPRGARSASRATTISATGAPEPLRERAPADDRPGGAGDVDGARRQQLVEEPLVARVAARARRRAAARPSRRNEISVSVSEPTSFWSSCRSLTRTTGRRRSGPSGAPSRASSRPVEIFVPLVNARTHGVSGWPKRPAGASSPKKRAKRPSSADGVPGGKAS